MKKERRHAELKRLFHVCLALDPGQRRSVLEREAPADPSLIDEVLELLAFDAASGAIPETAPPQPPREGSESELMERLASQRPPAERYDTLDKIAEGGMGSIWRVWDPVLRRPIAMKIAHGQRQGVPVDRFIEEAQVTGQLDHPGIVPVHELAIDHEGAVFFTMRLVRGCELKEVIAEYHRNSDGGSEWSLPRLLGVLQRICETMAYAHDKGVIHRDLKPSNVMIGQYGEVYVMDWGLARIFGQPETKGGRGRGPETVADVHSDRRDLAEATPDSPLFTMDGDIIGTPCYMPPEQALGRVSEVGPASDVYAIGALLYHTLIGRAPYVPEVGRRANESILRDVQSAPPRALTEVRADLAPELVAICERAMARRVDERYTSVTELGADLRAYLENRVVRAHETGPLIELRKWVQRNRSVACTLASSVALLVGLSSLSAAILSRKNEALVAAKDRAQESSERAERRFDELKGLASTVFFELDDKLRSLPGSTRARKFVVSRGLEYLDRIAAEGSEDPELLHELGSGYLRIAAIQGAGNQSNLGDLEGARASLDKARATLAKGAAIRPGHQAFESDLAVAGMYGADDALRRGEFDEAANGYAEALERYEMLADQSGMGTAYHQQRFTTLQRIGDLRRRLGELGSAAEAYEAAMSLALELITEQPEDAGNLELYAAGHQRLGRCWSLRGDNGRALEHFGAALEITSELLEADPGNAQHQESVAFRAIDLGDVLRDSGELDLALEHFQSARALRERFFEIDPANAWYAQMLGVALERVGHAMVLAGRSNAALPIIERSLEVRRSQADANPQDYELQRELSVAHEKASNVRAELGDLDGGLSHGQEARRIRTMILEAQPVDARAYRDLAVSEYKLGLMYSAAAGGGEGASLDGAEARRLARVHFEAALELHRRAANRGLAYPSDAGVPEQIRVLLERLDASGTEGD